MKLNKDNAVRWLWTALIVIVGARLLLMVAGVFGFEETLAGWEYWGISAPSIVLGAAALALYEHFK